MVICHTIGDPHFRASVEASIDTNAMAAENIRVAKERQPDFIVILGDTLDTHESINTDPLDDAVNFIDNLSQIAPVYLLIGNHDMKNEKQFLSAKHAFGAVKRWGSRVTVVDKTVKHVIKGKTFVFVPFVKCGRFIEALNTIDGWQEATAIFAHQEFRGAKYGKCRSMEGDVYPLGYPLVISGHIHDYEKLQPNIIYTGTCYQIHWGDHKKRTISYFTFEDTVQEERIKLNVPRKQILRLTCAEVSEYMKPIKCQTKFVITGTTAEIHGVIKHPNVAKWETEGHTMSYKTKDHRRTTFQEEKSIMCFDSLLRENIEKVGDISDLYDSIYGSK